MALDNAQRLRNPQIKSKGKSFALPPASAYPVEAQKNKGTLQEMDVDIKVDPSVTGCS